MNRVSPLDNRFASGGHSRNCQSHNNAVIPVAANDRPPKSFTAVDYHSVRHFLNPRAHLSEFSRRGRDAVGFLDTEFRRVSKSADAIGVHGGDG